jgi:hypothetical protein
MRREVLKSAGPDRGEEVMKLEKLRHHVLEGIGLFASDPPSTMFWEGFLDALESLLNFTDERGYKAGSHFALEDVREYLGRELAYADDPSDSEYIYGWRCALEEVRRVMRYVPSYRLQFKVSADTKAEARV